MLTFHIYALIENLKTECDEKNNEKPNLAKTPSPFANGGGNSSAKLLKVYCK